MVNLKKKKKATGKKFTIFCTLPKVGKTPILLGTHKSSQVDSRLQRISQRANLTRLRGFLSGFTSNKAFSAQFLDSGVYLGSYGTPRI